ncbi:hypothetical protein CBS101457_005828 [Exobasidium rhododendri]|nr:hypothetical protein CBS101457_005828 [Exobasidium rhododendri]
MLTLRSSTATFSPDRNQEATCYVGNLDERASDALVWELMLQAGPVFNVHLPKDRITSTHQGYGFAEFQTEVDAEYACKILNGIKLFGKPLRVNKASSDRKQVDIGANLFIGNLDAAVDERIMFETFSAFGNVVGLPKVARDEATGASRNFGFVSFDSFEASDAAIEALSNQHLLNRPITVSYAQKKDGKGGERHGTPAERLLATQARKNNALPEYRPFNFNARPPPPPPSIPGQAGMPQAIMGAPPVAPPPGFTTFQNSGQPGLLPPPPPPPPAAANGAAPMHYSGPPPQMPQMYDGPPPQFMTGSNGAPLGPRHG